MRGGSEYGVVVCRECSVALLALTQKRRASELPHALGDCCDRGHRVRRIDGRQRQHELCLRQFVWPNALWKLTPTAPPSALPTSSRWRHPSSPPGASATANGVRHFSACSCGEPSPLCSAVSAIGFASANRTFAVDTRTVQAALNQSRLAAWRLINPSCGGSGIDLPPLSWAAASASSSQLQSSALRPQLELHVASWRMPHRSSAHPILRRTRWPRSPAPASTRSKSASSCSWRCWWRWADWDRSSP